VFLCLFGLKISVDSVLTDQTVRQGDKYCPHGAKSETGSELLSAWSKKRNGERIAFRMEQKAKRGAN